MSIFPRLSLSAALMLSVAGSPAWADLTVDDAWNSWKAQFKAMGLTLSADQSREGEALQIGEVSLSAELPMDAGSLSMSFPGPRFEPLGDGTVRMSLPAESEMSFGGDIEGEGSLSMVLAAIMEDYEMIMSGTPDRIVTEGSVDATTMTLVSMVVDGEMLENASGTMTVDGYTYQTTTTIGDSITTEGTAAYQSFDMAYGFEFTEEDVTTGVSGRGFAKGAKMAHSMMLPADGLTLMALHQHLRDGMTLSLTAFAEAYGDKQETMVNGELFTSQNSEVADYDLTMTLDEHGIQAGGTTGAFNVDMQVIEMPFPIALVAEKTAGAFTMPLLSTGAVQDARMMLDMQGVTLNEEIWAMTDPAGQLPRDPIALRFDLTGEIDLTTDLVDVEAMSALEPEDNPIVPVSAGLKDLLLSAVGAELTGEGAFTFDAEDTETFPGMPRPEGAVDLQLVGANALIDKLVAMGLIPEDQAMSTRMMMGMFMTPGEGDDTLTSRIEINEEGHVLANGQRLR